MATSVKSPDVSVDEIRGLAEQELERWNVPAVEVVVVKAGEVLFAGGFGRSHVTTEPPVSALTVFAHGSTGKAFTAFLAGQMVDDGLVAWDTPVREYVPEFRLFDEAATARVTLRDLLCHRTGLPGHDLAWAATPSATRDDVVARLRYLEPVHDLRTTWQYCNYGFVVAGYVLGRAAGTTFEDELHRRIFEPLEMRRTYTQTATVQSLDDRAQPYRVKEDGSLEAIPFRRTDNICPAGGISSCAADTARWLMVQADGGAVGGKRLISEAAYQEIVQMQIPLPPLIVDPDLSVEGYGLAWAIGTYRGRRLVWHSGGIDGFLTEFMVLPDERIAIGICNNAASPLSVALARLLADRLLGADRDWGRELWEQAAKNRDALNEARAAAKTAKASAPPAHPLADYAGRYEHPGYGSIDVTEIDGALSIRIGELDTIATHRHYETWDLSLKFTAEMVLPATFFTDATGAVTDVYAALEATAPEPIRFRRSGHGA